METIFENIASKAGKAVRHWWLLLITGLLLVAGGLVVFFNPLQSYLTISVMSGVIMLITGAVELIVASTSRNYFAMRGYSIVGGICDLLLGILMLSYPGMTLILLPVMLGVYMLYHSFMIIGFGSDLLSLRVPGAGWSISLGVLLLLLSIFVIINPFSVGVGTIVVLVGVAMLLLGAAFIAVSFRMKSIHRYFRNLGPDEQ